MGTDEYERKRDFARTPEPRGRKRKTGARRRAPRTATFGQFVVQQHAARRMHWDFRLELDGVLKSWAVPKGPSLAAGERRLAAQTEDHPLEYATFEGVIPKGEYGGGTVIVWDRGQWQPLGDPHAGLAKGKLDFTLAGEKLRGRWHLVRMRTGESRAQWLLIKGRDAEARTGAAAEITATAPQSVLSGRDLDAVARAAGGVQAPAVVESAAPRRAATRRAAPRRAAGSARQKGGAATVAARSPLPRRFEPQLATLVDAPPRGADWLHELKVDGYRLLCRLDRGDAQLLSRNGLDWTERFPTLAAALQKLPAETALLDGEAVVVDGAGRTDFQALQRAFGQHRAVVVLLLFDCVHLDGRDLRDAPLVERKEALRQLLERAPQGSPLRYGDHVEGNGEQVFATACRSGAEGIVSKRASAPYRAGRTRAWLKVKCHKRQEFVIAGFTDPAGSRIGFGALLLAAHDATGALRYCGKVGTGFDHQTLAALHGRLGALERRQPPVVDPPRLRGVHWVAPQLVAEVAFTEWTRDRRVRHPTFVGLRRDKRAREVRIETAEPVPRAASLAESRSTFAGVELSTPDRVYFPELGLTKRELAAYWEAVAARALPGLVRRPLTLVRCPEGREGPCFYQKHALRSIPEFVPRVQVPGDREPYAMVTDLRGVIALVQIGALELHVCGARADRLDRPDLLVFDLDPDPAVPFARVVETACALRAWLEHVELAAFARVTGGKGVHVVVPLQRRASWDDAKAFAHGVARALVRLAPTALTDQMAKARRAGKIFVDYLRNQPSATAVASYSVRARPGAPVALPLSWEELEALDAPPRLSPRDVVVRLAQPDPWQDFESSRRALSRQALRQAGVD